MAQGVLDRRLAEGIAALRLDLAGDAQRRMLAYLAELEKWNGAYNLTAVRAPAAMVTRHLLDSLAVLPYVRDSGFGTRDSGKAGRMVDVGSGAGLPGVPLALAEPALRITLVESNGKKARFLRHVQRVLELPNLEVVEARAEAFVPAMAFDAVIARALGPLRDFIGQTAHLASASGHWLAMKGKLDAGEQAALPEGFQVKAIPLRIPGLEEERHLLDVSRVPSPESRVPSS